MAEEIAVEVRKHCYDYVDSYREYNMRWDAGIEFMMDKIGRQEKELKIKDEAIKRLLGYLKELGWERYPNQQEVNEFKESRKIKRVEEY